MNDLDLGALIKANRKKAGLTQLELANLAGIGKTTVFDIEKNKKTIRWSNLLAVLEVLNIKIEFKSPLNRTETMNHPQRI
ncbi:helix-turn-helix domain-containing protein [Aestuariibaculum sp. M13]|uniref:helix-turn-helix domain-containing protein n=1 Tax=Aestuariibaculum sp. M13 TaxID=2967132 RepID=UPI002159CFB2|nr:helix-turn-helix domain-containing protein [Aestuariibaculum sp. M13]MCR8668695.1 helix-turn-helix domain-containing protein [Aestuariibaculum sp. M13]